MDRQLSVALAAAVVALHVGVILFNVFGLVAVLLRGPSSPMSQNTPAISPRPSRNSDPNPSCPGGGGNA